jgi:Zn-dependent peptidase ImmA (M78 family)
MLVRGRNTRHQRQEREANTFAIELLAPTYLIQRYLRGEANLDHPLRTGQHLEISFEAATCRYVDLHDEPLAAVVTERGSVRYAVRNDRFPWIKLGRGDRISPITAAYKAISTSQPVTTRLTEGHAAAWLGNPDVEIFEQTRVSPSGHSVTLLWATPPEESDNVADDFERTRPSGRGRPW